MKSVLHSFLCETFFWTMEISSVRNQFFMKLKNVYNSFQNSELFKFGRVPYFFSRFIIFREQTLQIPRERYIKVNTEVICISIESIEVGEILCYRRRRNEARTKETKIFLVETLPSKQYSNKL